MLAVYSFLLVSDQRHYLAQRLTQSVLRWKSAVKSDLAYLDDLV